MNCALCFRLEILKRCDGSKTTYDPTHIKGREVNAIVCSTCTSKLILRKVADVPWDGIVKKLPADPNEPVELRRRKGG